jgi:hypothetical protein
MRCDDTICANDDRLPYKGDNTPCGSTSYHAKDLQFHQALYSRDRNQVLTDECWMRMICWVDIHRTNVSVVIHIFFTSAGILFLILT